MDVGNECDFHERISLTGGDPPASPERERWRAGKPRPYKTQQRRHDRRGGVYPRPRSCSCLLGGKIRSDAAEHDSRDIVGFVHPKN
jgi:hypothetical protein